MLPLLIHPRDLRRGVTSFSPPGMGRPVLYAVSVVDHPDLVKVGQSCSWPKRRCEYADWNLRDGDGLLSERVFELHDEWIDLLALESAVLSGLGAPARRREWFAATIDAASAVIRDFLCANDISFTEVE